MEFSIEAQKREKTGKSGNRKLRENGRVPAVLYGRDLESVNLQVNRRDIRALLKEGALKNVLVNLELEGESESRPVLIKDADIHPVKSELLHVDFHQVSPEEEVQVEVPIELVGESVGVEQEDGIIDQPLRVLEVSCEANNIPASVEVDITEMEIGDVIFVSDIKTDSGVEMLTNKSRTVLSIQPPEEFDTEVTPAAGVATVEETVEEAMEKVAEGEEVEEGEEAVEGEEVEEGEEAPEGEEAELEESE